LPSTNFGASTQLKVDSSPVLRTFLKFAVSGLTEPVTSATLRIHTADTNKASSSAGGTFGSVSDTAWLETAVTWNNQPAIGGALGTLGSVSRNTWYQIDVTSAITGNGTYSIGATSPNTNDAIYDSRETGANAPQLVVTTGVSSNDPVLVGAGDIASCSSTGDEATANLLDGISGTVFTAGDNVYDNGTTTEFNNCYDPTWGRHKARTKPSAGNHDYNTPGATGYYGYFGAAAGDPTKGYYSYDIGSWHVVAINSNCAAIGGCHAGSAQEQWLRQDLMASNQPCTIAYWHHPRFTSGANHSPSTFMTPIWQALYDFNADVVVAGHNHQYERFAPQTANGTLDTVRGIREFVVGTGGRSHYNFATIQPNSEVRNSDTYGVIKLTLHANGYDWQFVPEAGKTFTDSGSNNCH
jgi:acid phosphatase type 7